MTSAAQRAKLEYLSGVKTLGEAARLEQSEQAAAVLAAVRPEEASSSEFGELLLSLDSGVGFAALLRHARARAPRGWLLGARLGAPACPRILHRARCFRDRQPFGNLSRCPWGGLWIHAAWTATTVSPRLQVLDVLYHATYATKWPRHAHFGASRGAS